MLLKHTYIVVILFVSNERIKLFLFSPFFFFLHGSCAGPTPSHLVPIREDVKKSLHSPSWAPSSTIGAMSAVRGAENTLRLLFRAELSSLLAPQSISAIRRLWLCFNNARFLFVRLQLLKNNPTRHNKTKQKRQPCFFPGRRMEGCSVLAPAALTLWCVSVSHRRQHPVSSPSLSTRFACLSAILRPPRSLPPCR